jgi:hypothetical protein
MIPIQNVAFDDTATSAMGIAFDVVGRDIPTPAYASVAHTA